MSIYVDPHLHKGKGTKRKKYMDLMSTSRENLEITFNLDSEKPPNPLIKDLLVRENTVSGMAEWPNQRFQHRVILH